MKKKFGFLIVVLSIMLALAACGKGESADGDGEKGSNGGNDSKGKTYTVATDSNFKPFEYLNTDTGELEGFDIDLIKEIADRAGFKVEFEQMDFDGLLAGMQGGRYEIGVAGMSITDERKETLDFSDPYYDSGIILMVPTDSDIKSIDDVDGKKIGSRQGSTSESYLNKNTKAQVEAYPEIVTAYMNLAKGKLDGALYDVPNVQYYIAQEGKGKLKTTGDILQGESYGIAFKKGSELVDDTNEALASMIKDGTYAEIYEKYFGEKPADKWLGEE
ncbi:transporter substrate-binding domain-containing protein [Lederbergia sp. NSJ-179]|uniref:transporter substrate-binding domain-containing protein n=1 Tax=Lederbergia sp. NSJ-179 TaxID=2931402 RepID=UPI001FD27EC0|nr:transporter substrate-binding domain-containing protein [Lederbergia sp. NSJ-179]MCJ7842585.1 transporter substrate-binding domain-containing protein [Lederbergia sp. NSJ-179]